MNPLWKRLVTGRGTTFMVLGIDGKTPTSALGEQLFYTGGDVLVQIMPSLGKLTSELHLFDPIHRYLATNRDSGGPINLGSFAPGSELIFGICVRETGHRFLMGPSSRNPDGLIHASINWMRSGVAIVQFQDIWGEDSQDLTPSFWEFEDAIEEPRQTNPPTLLQNNLKLAPFSSLTNVWHSPDRRAS